MRITMTTNDITRVLGCAAALAMLAGCPSENKGGAAGSAKAAGSAAADEELTDEQVDKEEIPTEADFEEKAQAEITEDNYLDELAKEEAALASDSKE